MGKFVAFVKRLKAKSVSASRGLPFYRLALCALAMSPSLPNPKYATVKIQHCVGLYVFLCIYVRPSVSQCWPQLQWRSQKGGKAPRIIQTKRKYTSKLHKIWPILSVKRNENRCHQISFFKTKMHQI